LKHDVARKYWKKKTQGGGKRKNWIVSAENAFRRDLGCLQLELTHPPRGRLKEKKNEQRKKKNPQMRMATPNLLFEED